MNEDVAGCTTEQQNTHGTEVHELLYPWHPWSGRLIHIHQVLDKGIAVFRCSLTSDAAGRWLEIPVWMFDRIASAHWRTMPVPHVELASLRALARILEEAGTPSQREEIGAALDSHEASRGDVHATSVHDLSVRSVLGLHSGRSPAIPQWQALPEEARQTLTALIVRLLVDHANGGSASQQKEAGYDA
ncbi:hypothetical protein SAMN05216228_10784 [Rhizobium tibeticum]|uniref:Uncharacterized protein n=1 Tax=Rhizobium tibeticum TaxID=501024 RepID=A0A1H8WU19_9HYPH|nr:hypothetical protein RTCCBAU85039_6645 [Rhizobium tibeticum]SEP30983.1 hypothetical protein SAMN05216228_10784 [Rhizobium tibeticum]